MDVVFEQMKKWTQCPEISFSLHDFYLVAALVCFVAAYIPRKLLLDIMRGLVVLAGLGTADTLEEFVGPVIGVSLANYFIKIPTPFVLAIWACWVKLSWWKDVDKDGDKDTEDLFKGADKNGDGKLDASEVLLFAALPVAYLFTLLITNLNETVALAKKREKKINEVLGEISKLRDKNLELTKRAKEQHKDFEKLQSEAEQRTIEPSEFSELKKEDHPHCISASDITFGKVLGKGGFGLVTLGEWKGQDVAIKMIKRERLMSMRGDNLESAKEDFLNEISLLKDARHPNVVLLLGWNVTGSGDFMAVMEVMGRGSLEDCITRDVREKRGEFKWGANGKKIAEDILKGLCFLHESNPPRCHLDLKTENILVSADLTAKIGDLGLTRKGEGTGFVPHQRIGYQPPEIMKGKRWGPKSDMYAVAMVMVAIDKQQEPMHMDKCLVDGSGRDLNISEEELKYAIEQQEQGEKSMWSSKVETWVHEGQNKRIKTKDFTDKPVLIFIDDCLKKEEFDRPTSKSFLNSGVLSAARDQLKNGDVVRIVKRGSRQGHPCKIIDRFWSGAMIKVELLTEPDKGETRSYHLYELEKA